jgi:hypothetical protein
LVLTVIHGSAVPTWFPDGDRAAPTVQPAKWDRHPQGVELRITDVRQLIRFRHRFPGNAVPGGNPHTALPSELHPQRCPLRIPDVDDSSGIETLTLKLERERARLL